MREHVDAYTENLKERVQPIIEKILDELKNLYKKYPLKTYSDHEKWEEYFRLCEENPEEIKFYISRLAGYEDQLTLKTGINTDEKTDQRGFILPLTLGHATELLSKITPEDYKTLCKYAVMSHILFLQDKIDSIKSRYAGAEIGTVDEAFIAIIRRDIQPLVALANALEDQDLDQDWRQIIQLYFVQ